MNQKEYELIASHIDYVLWLAPYMKNDTSPVRSLALRPADDFEENYPSFDRKKFLKACGL